VGAEIRYCEEEEAWVFVSLSLYVHIHIMCSYHVLCITLLCSHLVPLLDARGHYEDTELNQFTLSLAPSITKDWCLWFTWGADELGNMDGRNQSRCYSLYDVQRVPE